MFICIIYSWLFIKAMLIDVNVNLTISFDRGSTFLWR